MANSLGTDAIRTHIQLGYNFIKKEHPVLGRIGTKLVTGDQVNFGDTIKVKTAVVGTASAWDGSDLTSDDAAVTEASVTINKRFKYGVRLTAAELAKYGTGLSDAFARILIYPAVDYIMAAVAGLWTKANIPNETVETVADVDCHTFARLSTPLNTRYSPKAGRFAIINENASETLKGDPTLVRVNESGTSGTLREGVIGRLSGFDVMEYTEVPTAENLIGIGGSPDSIVFAGREVDHAAPFADIPNPTLQTVVSDPDLGLSLLIFGRTNTGKPGDQELFILGEFGVNIGRAESAQRLVSAATTA